jgi:exonuclease III
MKIATYNVNGVNGRLPVLLRWLDQAEPDIVCLQELKSPDEKFPSAAIEKAGYGAIGMGKKAGTASPFSRANRSRRRRDAACQETLTTPIADISRPSSPVR